MPRQILSIALATCVGVVLLSIPIPQSEANIAGFSGLTTEARNLAAVFAITLVLWATEAIPIAVTALLAIVLQPLLGIVDLNSAFGSFISPVFFFVVAMFIIAGTIIEVGLDRRFALFLLFKAGSNTKRILFALMLGTAVLSSFISDVPACAVFMAVGLAVLTKMGVAPGSSSFGKGLMIGIPIAALIGGVATPAGSSINVLALDLLEAFSRKHELDVQVTFVQWMGIGVPMVVFLLPIAWWVIVRCYPPEVESIGSPEAIQQERSGLGRFNLDEWKVLVIVATMMILWIAGSWIEILNVSMVALLGAIVMFLPGIELMDWKQAERHIGWDTLFMIGGVTALGKASVHTGLADWLVQATIGGMQDLPVFWLVALISLFTVLIHLPLPIAPVVNAVLIPPVATLALTMGINPVLVVLPVAFTASCAFLLPLDAVPLLTYTKGYYRMFDMLLPGTIISIFWIVAMTAMIVFVAPALGFY